MKYYTAITALIIALLLAFNASAQPYAIGYMQDSFYDDIRQREVPVHIYYPAQTPGTQVAVAAGSFPVLVFGHGLAMVWSAYENYWTELVPKGYIMVFPTTEGGVIPSPDHGAFGEDLLFLNKKMKLMGQDTSSLFYQHVAYESALMGHSMGGGASFLAAANQAGISALVTFAPAETNPSAIDAAKHIDIPALIFYGENDGVTPLNQHQMPMYQSLESSCKIIIGIKGGGHCFFANRNIICEAAELLTTPQPSISRAEQHKVIFDFLLPYLNYKLKQQQGQMDIFLDSLQNSHRITYKKDCNSLNIKPNDKGGIHMFPNPLPHGNPLNIVFENSANHIAVYNLKGEMIYFKTIERIHNQLDLNHLSKGFYTVRINTTHKDYMSKLIIH